MTYLKSKKDQEHTMSLLDKMKFDFFAWLFVIGCGGSVFVAWLFCMSGHTLYAVIAFVVLAGLIPFSNKKMDALTQKYKW